MEMITLNLIPKGIPPVCHASQYDKGRVIRCNLVDGLQGYVLSGETAVLNVIKPDNNIVTEALTATTGNSYIDIITTEQMCAVAGKNECEIRLTKGEVEVGTLNFIMQVEADVTTGGIESETVIHDLKTTISDMVKEEIEAISPEEELSGAMASFETHEIAPLVDCKVKIEAIQSGSGTPSPDNVRQITGFTECNVTRTSKNLITPTLSPNRNPRINNVTVTKDYDNVILTTTAAIDYTCYGVFYSLKKGTYTFKYQANSSDSYTPSVTIYRNGSVVVATNISPNTARTFTIAEDITIEFRLFASTVGDGVVGRVVTFYEMQLELGTTATDYEPYNSETKTIDFNGNTVYGGELDVTTGLLTVTHGIVDIGDMNWVYYSNNKRFIVALNDGKRTGTAWGLDTALCSCYPVSLSEYGSIPDDSISVGSNFLSGSTCAVVIHDETYTDATALKTALSGQKIVYELATPITVQLTPTEIKTILGVNHIWADTGDIDVVYHHELTARYVYFDNTGTDLTATNVEAAIKELWSRLQ